MEGWSRWVPAGHLWPREGQLADQRRPRLWPGLQTTNVAAAATVRRQGAVKAIEAEIEARAAGFDADRLARIDRHFRR